MKFSLWLEGKRRNQKSATRMPDKKTDLELHQKAASKRAFEMQHGKAGVIPTKIEKKKGSRSQQQRRDIRDKMD